MIDEHLSVELLDDLRDKPLDTQFHAPDKTQVVGWQQTTPAQMPWGMPTANQPAIMRFTGDAFTANPAVDRSLIFMGKRTPLKRRIYQGFDVEPEMPPSKQFITEEKMAANLDGLHISNDYVPHQCGTVNTTELPGSTLQQTTEEPRMPTLVLCEELRRLTAEAVLPPTVMTRVERPTNALVLWQPPAGDLGARLQQIVEACKASSSKSSNSTKSTTWQSYDNNNSSNTEDLNEQKSKKNEQCSGSLPDDSLMEL